MRVLYHIPIQNDLRVRLLLLLVIALLQFSFHIEGK